MYLLGGTDGKIFGSRSWRTDQVQRGLTAHTGLSSMVLQRKRWQVRKGDMIIWLMLTLLVKTRSTEYKFNKGNGKS